MKQILCALSLGIAAFVVTTSSFASTSCDGNTGGSLPTVPNGGTIVDGSYPCFVTPVEFVFKGGKYFSAKYKDGNFGVGQSLFFANKNASYNIGLTTFNFNAVLDDNNGILYGSVDIFGRLGGGVGPVEQLLHADVSGFWGYGTNVVGFNTSGIKCSDSINALIPGGCTTNEVLFFDLGNSVFDPNDKKFKSLGTALTSVPLPAAVWLFGAGLVSLAGIGRRRTAA